MDLAKFLRDIPDFPKPGIIFKDITPLLASPAAFAATIDRMADLFGDAGVQRVAAVESRGFIFGAPLALRMDVGFTPIRKPGKLPFATHKLEYLLEYGKDSLEIHVDGVAAGERVLMVDDLLATGGTMQAACDLVERIGGSVVACGFVVELAFLHGRAKLEDRRVESLVKVR
jgi:adenine phosphoribosyltransferase